MSAHHTKIVPKKRTLTMEPKKTGGVASVIRMELEKKE